MEDFEHPAHATLNEYSSARYRPDVDFVDGELIDRLFGEFPHSAVRGELFMRLHQAFASQAIYTSLRIQTAPHRIRVADIAVLGHKLPDTGFVTEAPILCAEVLEPQDILSNVDARVRDFLAMGVPEVWLFDPAQRSVTIAMHASRHEVQSGTLSPSGVSTGIDVESVFATLDE